MAQPLPTDEILSQTYVKLNIPSDSLVRSPSQMRKFIEQLPDEHHSLDAEKLADRIIRLRKDGQLPRLRRSPK